MAIKLTEQEICHAARIEADLIIRQHGLAGSEHVLCEILEPSQPVDMDKVSAKMMILICRYGTEQYQRIVQLVLEKIRARKKTSKQPK